MAEHTILLSNLGYARGINGDLAQHLRFAHRHFYCPPGVQEKVLKQLSALIEQYQPDLCCFVEIDKGSRDLGNFDQLASLVNAQYAHFDIENKYGERSRLRRFAFTRGKSNAFVSKKPFPFEKIYFPHGVKRLIYKIQLEENLTLFFAHFSLKRRVRAMQLDHIKRLIADTPGEVIFLGDFNILNGFSELDEILREDGLVLLNRKEETTFQFHRRKLVLDLCLCSPSVAKRAQLTVVPQPFSDHAALVLKVAA